MCENCPTVRRAGESAHMKTRAREGNKRMKENHYSSSLGCFTFSYEREKKMSIVAHTISGPSNKISTHIHFRVLVPKWNFEYGHM